MALKLFYCESSQIEENYIFKWVVNGNSECPKLTYHNSRIQYWFGNLSQFSCELGIEGSVCGKKYYYFELLKYPAECNLGLVYLWVNGETEKIHSYISPSNTSATMQLTKEGKCLLHADICTIMCELHLQTWKTTKSLSTASNAGSKSTLTADFTKLFESKQFWDVTLVMPERELHAHKNILASRSKVFAAMFETDMEEAKTNKVEIDDIAAEVMEEVLRFIYTDKVEKLDKLALEILAASDKYDLPLLKSICADEFSKRISIKDAAELLMLSNLYKLETLKHLSQNFIMMNRRNVARTEGWQKLCTTNCHLLEELFLNN